MTVLTIAIGEEYLASASRLAQAIPALVIVTEDDLVAEHQHRNARIAAKRAKTGFGAYLPAEATGPVLLLDADTQVQGDPFAGFQVPDADLAAVPWLRGRITWPRNWPAAVKSVINGSTSRLNTGVIWFKDRDTAAAFSTEWHETWATHAHIVASDEPAFLVATASLGLDLADLDERYNSRDPETGVFLHTHYLPVVERLSLRRRKSAVLTKARENAIRELAAGVTIGDITLAAQDRDQQAFARLLILLRENHDLQPDATARQAFLATPQVITDINGAPHTLQNVRKLRQLLVAYGNRLRDLWTAHATKRTQIKAATTHEELDAILAAD